MTVCAHCGAEVARIEWSACGCVTCTGCITKACARHSRPVAIQKRERAEAKRAREIAAYGEGF